MAESNRGAITALGLGIVGLFTAGGLGLGSLVGLVLAATALARTPSRDNDVAWAALVANVFALLTVIPIMGTLFAYQSLSRPGATITTAPPPAPVEESARPEAPPPPAPPTTVLPRGVGQEPAPEPASGRIKEPRKTHHVNPAYPPSARKARIQGVVILECTINPEGQVVEVEVLQGVPELDQAAIEAVRQWRYTPTLLNGVAVPVIMTVTVNFKLDSGVATTITPGGPGAD